MMQVRLLASMALVAATGLFAGCGSGEEAAAAPNPSGQSQAVLVELFTSQGCSSCPPADLLLGQLPEVVDGIQVLPLAFHVDYWDGLGWRDPFSSADWTERQNLYARAIASGRLYTPQLVVQGSAHVVGSDRKGAADLIRAAARRQPTARVQATAKAGRDRMTVSVDASLGRGPAADAWVALVESGLATRVARGENQGRALDNHFVVRRLVRAFRLEPGASRRGDVALALDPSWRRDRLAVTVFVQEPDSLAIVGAAAAR